MLDQTGAVSNSIMAAAYASLPADKPEQEPRSSASMHIGKILYPVIRLAHFFSILFEKNKTWNEHD